MVKTRHSADVGKDSFEGFISVHSRRTRANIQYDDQLNGFESDSSGELAVQSIQKHRKRAKVEQESSIDDVTPDKSLRKDFMVEDADDEGDVIAHTSGRTSKHHLGHRSRDEEPVMNGNYTQSGTRRSTRQRKLIYSTFDQNLIDQHLDIINETATASSAEEVEAPCRPRNKRRRLEVQATVSDDNFDGDMYTRVKRIRRKATRQMYGRSVLADNAGKGNEEEETTSESDSTDEDDAHEEEEKGTKQYFLRQHKPQTNLYTVPIEPKRTKTRNIFSRISPPRQNRRRQTASYRSPARLNTYIKKRRRPQFHGNSSTSSSSISSSDEDESEDDLRFERRKAKSMAKARNRCLPMNFDKDDVVSGYVRDRTKVGSSLADVDPMNIDRSVTFESVGGLGKYLQSLKEMIVFPLLYPEVFDRFKISPPRGVLFYGPPGTGKTLVARALANECSKNDQKVAFFMRKGADCLSKWVGESERQLRLLFDQAYQMRPSIIFFDEIDGLAPVRSSRQDQIHSSIVSTLLALMDGLDSRGEIVIIGATNRIDSIDPALRRPGRFDREFHFSLPSVDARKQILQIHTKEWNPKPCDAFMEELAEKCVGYCGADLKALCTEGALHALRRRYPQIYMSNDKLELDVTSIQVSAKDFHRGMQNIVPASQRSVISPGRTLSPIIQPLLERMFKQILDTLQTIFPSLLAQTDRQNTQGLPPFSDAGNNDTGLELTWYSDDEDDCQTIYQTVSRGRPRKRPFGEGVGTLKRYLDFNSYSYQRPVTHRPRLLLSGNDGQGQSSHLAPAVLHNMERLPLYVLDLPALYAVSVKTPEESCAQIFREACRTSPSIIYMPHIGHWWDVITDTLRATFLHLLGDLQPSTPVLVLATSDQKYHELQPQVQHLFDVYSGEVVTMQNPNQEERREFFKDLLLIQTKKPPPTKKTTAQIMLEVLPKAKPQEPRKLTETELKKIRQQEADTLRELRLFLRDVINKLGRDRKFGLFSKPVDIEEVTDYYDIIANPMDLSTMMSKIDLHKYQCVKEFMDDINLICSNALEYNPDKDPAGRAIRHRACALRDTTQAILSAELDPEFEKLCEEIVEARKRRGEKGDDDVPSFYHTKPLDDRMRNQLNIQTEPPEKHYGHRTRSMDDMPITYENIADKGDSIQPMTAKPELRRVIKRVCLKRPHYSNKKSPWCKPTKRRYKKVVIYVDQYGNEVKRDNTDEDNTELEEEKDSTMKEEEKSQSNIESEKKHEEEKKTKAEKLSNRLSCRSMRSNLHKEDLIDTKVKVDIEMLSDDISDTDRGRKKRHGWASTHTSPNNQSPKTAVTSSGRRTSSPYATISPTGNVRSPLHSPVSTPIAATSEASNTLSPKDFLQKSTKRTRSLGESEPEVMDTTAITGKKSHRTQQTADQASTGQSPTGQCGTSPVQVTGDNPSRDSSSPPSKPAEPRKEEASDAEKEEEKIEEDEEKQNNKENEEKGLACDDSSPKLRLTRSQVNPKVQEKAAEVLAEPVRDVVIDEEKMKHILERCVELTENYNVEQLERLYSRLSHSVFQHRNDYDKSKLVQDIEMIVNTIRMQ